MSVPAAALLLLAATFAAWAVAAGARPAARLQLRFAGILLAAQALAVLAAPSAASAVALLVLPVAVGVLALAAMAGFSKPLPAAAGAILLAAICLAALAAAITGFALFSLAPAAAAAVALALICLRQFDAMRTASVQGLLSAVCFLAAMSAFAAEGSGRAFALFAAAGLLGLTLALSRSDLGREERPVRDLRRRTAIRKARQA